MNGVPWRRVGVAFVAVAVALSGVFVALRADGFDATDANVPRATRWFVDNTFNQLVLVDGFAGKLLAKIDLETESNQLQVVQSASGAAILDRSEAATSRTIDTAALRLGSAQSLDLITERDAVIGVGQAGVVAVAPTDTEGVLLPPEGDPLRFEVGEAGRDDATRIAPDGAVWTISGGSFLRITTTGREAFASGLGSARFSLAGNTAVLLDAERGRVRFGTGKWLSLPDDPPPSEIVVQQPGPPASCGWIGGNDRLWCVGTEGFVEEVEIDGLDIDGGDLLAIAGDAGALVRTATSEIVQLDWRAGRQIDPQLTPRPGAVFAMASSVDLVWVEDVAGRDVWAFNPWGVEDIRKTDPALLLGESGEVIDAAEVEGDAGGAGTGVDEVVDTAEFEPDDDGLDEAPQARDDQVTARFGISVPIAVTANDFDPDGDAIAVIGVTPADRGLVTIQDASTVVYAPEVGMIGLDAFSYTITDGAGNEDTATVTVQLLPADAPNTAPKGTPDRAQTRINNPVVVDVLANDFDPERDTLQIGRFDSGNRGVVKESEGPTGQPALEFTPLPNVSGTATFEYRPVDAFGALGESVEVTVEIARESDDNLPPVARPDAVRVRRDVTSRLPVLANDSDPDGDRMNLSLDNPERLLQFGIEVRVEGDDLVITARAGARPLIVFEYTVSDGVNTPVEGSVLVSMIPDAEPNAPPLANADTDSAVVGVTKLIDVLANDFDPDRDPLVITSVSQPEDGSGIGTVRIQGDRIEYVVDRLASDEAVFDRFEYVIDDGQGNDATGEVTVRVLPEPIDQPPFARPDSASTVVDVPVTIDVLRNDGDPSGLPIALRGGIGCPAGGTGTIIDPEVRFTPPLGRSGTFTCTYEIGNSQGLTAAGEFSVSVVLPPVANQPPVVPPKTELVLTGSSTSIFLLAGVTDPDVAPGDSPLEVTSVSSANVGRVDRIGNSPTITYVAPPVEDNVTITYTVRDADGGVMQGTVQITIVEPEPIPPDARDDITSELNDRDGVTVAVQVLDNDNDPDLDGGDPLQVTAATVIQGGATVAFTGTTVTVTFDDRFYGRIRVRYEITDHQNLTDTAEIVVDATEPANRPPTANDDAAEVANGASVAIPIALNDSDIDGDALAYSIVSGASSVLGQAGIQNGSTLVFAAAPGASGTAVVVYSVSDGEFTDNAIVRITVLPCAQSLPEAPDLNLVTGYQTPIFIDLTTQATNGDIVDVGPPLSAPSGIYTPPAGFNDNVTFNYVVRNACRIEAVGRVLIDVNQDPIANPFSTDMGRQATLSVPLERLATDPNTDPLVISALEGAPPWVTLAADSRGFTATPAGASGLVQFTAVVTDVGGLTARVPVSLNLVNLAPVPVDDQYRADNGAVVMDVLANDADPDGDTITLQSVPATVTFTNGVTVALEQIGNASIRLTPGAGVGTATFDYGIIDSQNLPSTQTARVTITVNTPPTAPQIDVSVVAGTTQPVTVNSTDPDGGPLVVTLESDPTPLTIVINGLELQITAPIEAAGNQYSLIYRVTDPNGASTTGTLNIMVLAPEPPPPPPPTTPPPG